MMNAYKFVKGQMFQNFWIGLDGYVYPVSTASCTARELYLTEIGYVRAVTRDKTEYTHRLFKPEKGSEIYILCGQYMVLWKASKRSENGTDCKTLKSASGAEFNVYRCGTVMKNGTFVKPSVSAQGEYEELRVKGTEGLKKYVHQLVYQAFSGVEITEDYCIDHINGNNTDNNYNNLQLLPSTCTVWGAAWNHKRKEIVRKRSLNSHLAYMHKYGETVYLK